MSTVRAIVVDPEAPGRLAIQEVEAPLPTAHEALVQVEATSLNPGELQVARQVDAGWRPGRDLAGVVVRQASDGSGPAAGTRVVGMRDDPGVWAERVAVLTTSLAPLPDTVRFADAATLGVAGLTALYALKRGGLLLNKRVLITGATGGVGLFAVQLARLSGAEVVGTVRRESDIARVRDAGADHVTVGDDLTVAAERGPYHLVIDSLGGDALASTLSQLAPDGMCVNLGWGASARSTIDVMAFNRTGGASLYGLRLDTELRGRSKTEDLTGLARLVAEGRLTTSIDVEASWTDVARIAADLLERRVKGKAVLHIHDGAVR